MSVPNVMRWVLELYPITGTTFGDLNHSIDEAAEIVPADAIFDVAGTCLRFKWTEQEDVEDAE